MSSMVSIFPYLFEALGGIIVHKPSYGSNFEQLERRVTKNKTLDGGVSIVDYGYVVGDREFAIVLRRPTKEQLDLVKYLIENHNYVTVSNREGVFYCIISNINHDRSNDELEINVLIKSKLSS